MEVHIQDFRIIYRILKILQQSMDLTKPNIHTRGLEEHENFSFFLALSSLIVFHIGSIHFIEIL